MFDISIFEQFLNKFEQFEHLMDVSQKKLYKK